MVRGCLHFYYTVIQLVGVQLEIYLITKLGFVDMTIIPYRIHLGRLTGTIMPYNEKSYTASGCETFVVLQRTSSSNTISV